jgi:hypothetical protein
MKDGHGGEWLVQRRAGGDGLMVARREEIPNDAKYLDFFKHIFIPPKDTWPRAEDQWNIDKAFEVAMDLVGIPIAIPIPGLD